MSIANHHLFFDQLPISGLLLNTEFRIKTASNLFLSHTKISLDEIVGQNFSYALSKNGANFSIEELNKIQRSLTTALQNKITDKVTVTSNSFEKLSLQLTHVPVLDEANNVESILQIREEIYSTKNHEHLRKKNNKIHLQNDATQQRYYDMLMDSPFGFSIMTGDNFLITVANDMMKAFWGKGNDIEGTALLQILPELKNQPFLEKIQEVFTSGKPVYANDLLVRLEVDNKNEDRFFNIICHPYYEEEQNTSGVATIAYEVTEMVMARKKMEETEMFNKSFLENSPDCIKIIDKNGRIEFINENGLCLLEIDNIAEAETKYWWDLWEEQNKPMIKEAVSAALSKEKVRFQASSNTAKGTPKWWDIIVMPLRVDEATNKAERLLTVSRDITDFKNANLKLEESEQHFRQLADLIPSKISNATADGQMLYLNEKWLEYTGKTFEELQGLGYYDILHPEDIKTYGKNLLNALQTGKPLNMEMRFLNKYGEYKWHLNLATPVKDQQGKIKTWVGNTIEIDEQVKQKEMLETAVAQRTIELEIANKELIYQNLEKEKRSAELGVANSELAFQNAEKEKRSNELLLANKELQSFTYVASHDLQEPLRKITFFAERIIESELQNLTDTGRDYFRRMQSAAVRMRQLIEDLLSFSRVNIIDREMVVTDLKSIVLEVEEELKESIENKHIVIDIHSTCEVRVIVFQFRQLMHNLIGNSIKFAQQDVTPNITINSHIAYGRELNNEDLIPEDSYCHISLKDNGIGFEPEYSKRIFEVFQKLHSKETYKGTGIGLAIVKKIVDNHNGIITASGILGEGATFHIYLPV